MSAKIDDFIRYPTLAYGRREGLARKSDASPTGVAKA